MRDKEMEKQFNNNQYNNQGGQNRQQFVQQMRDTTPHNYIQKSDQNMYSQYEGQQSYGQNQNNQQPQYYRPYQNYGVDSNQRPAIVSDGGCCCSLM